jgi:Domain of unknown function (DUF4912)
MWAALRAAGRDLRHRDSSNATALSNGHERIERAKYTPPALAPAADPDELPDSYGHPRVTLMVVDPYLIHAYWDIDIASLPRQTSSAVLRFQVASERSFEVDVDLRVRNWYVHIESPAKSYYAELGVKTAAGGFLSLATSNRVRTPRAWPIAQQVQSTELSGSAEHLPNAEPFSNAQPLQNPQPLRDENAREVDPSTSSREAAGPPPLLSSVPGEAPAPPQIAHAPRRVDAAQVLEQKLAEIYALRPWRSPAAAAPFEVTASAAVRLSSAAPAGRTPAPLEQLGSLLDPTALAEHAFSPGLPSSSFERPRSGVQP